ncbi:MAG: hypothetical protein OXG04_20025 [Acidobacteria bacterium]|nr:hypothetical protein [Acidobacteriota bacterium]
MVSVAKKKEVVVTPTFFFDTAWIIARPAWLCSFNVADFADVEVVVFYDLVLAPGKRANIPGLREQGPDC